MNKLSKTLTIVLAVLMAVSAILMIILMSNIDAIDAGDHSLVELNLNWVYFLLIACAGLAIVFSVINIVRNPQNLKKALISLGVIAVVIVLAYSFASDFIPDSKTASDMIAEGTLTPSKARWIGTAIWSTYLLLFAAIGATIWASVSRLVKR